MIHQGAVDLSAFAVTVCRGYAASPRPWCWRVSVRGRLVDESKENQQFATELEAFHAGMQALLSMLRNHAIEASREFHLVAGSCSDGDGLEPVPPLELPRRLQAEMLP